MRAPKRCGDGQQALRAPAWRSRGSAACARLAAAGSPGCRRRSVRAAEVVAHQAVEVVRRGGAGVGLEVDHFGLLLRRPRPSSRATRAVSSSVVPSGMSTITWNSLLLSNGSIFTLTKPTSNSEHRAEQQDATTPPGSPSAAAAWWSSGPMTRR